MTKTGTTTEFPQTILVVGATGRTGRHVVAGLLDRGIHVRALVRSPLTASLPGQVEVIQGDLDDPASVSNAANGADAAFLLWHRFSADGSEEVVTALAEHVRHIVYLSAANLGEGSGEGPVEGVWAEIEALIEKTDASHTFVRGGGFAANTLEWADQIRRGDTVRMPFPKAARSVVDERDLADVSVRALLDPTLAGAAITVTGPETLTQLAQVEAIGAALGRTLVVEEQSAEGARRQYAVFMGESYAKDAVSHWESLVDRPEPPRDGVQEILGRPARTFADWAAYHVEDFRMLSVAEVAERYADGFRAGDIATATQLLAPDVARVAPLENGGEPVEVRGLAEVMANAELLTANVETNAVEVGDPLVGPTSFAIRFTFDETRRDTGQRQTTTKMSLCTVAASRITREEVFYFTPAHN